MSESNAHQEVDWEKVDAVLIERFQLKPWEIMNLTLSEISFYLHLASGKKNGLDLSMSTDEEYARWWSSLTAREKLELIMEGIC